MPIPFLDLKAQYERIRFEVEPAVLDVLASGSYVLGPEVEKFEKAFAEYCGVEHAVGVASGTDALVLILDALGIGPGHEVITTPFTFFATAESISRVGAMPVFVDIDPVTLNIDPELVEAAITPKTKAVMPVHLFGRLADMQAISRITKDAGIYVIEDACQAIGASLDGKSAGSLGIAAAFSFYPTKNLGGVGDGGIVTTDDAGLASRIKLLRDHGSSKRYHHAVLGYNSRLDAVQAVVLGIKLKYLDEWNEARRTRADKYSELLEPMGVSVPMVDDRAAHVFHLYTCRSEFRNRVIEKLAEERIGCGIYYPLPLHLQEAYRDLGYSAGDLPNAELASREVFSLPIYPELDDEAMAHVVDTVRSALEQAG